MERLAPHPVSLGILAAPTCPGIGPKLPASPQRGHVPLTPLLLLAGSWLCQPLSFTSPPTTSSGITCTPGWGRGAGATTSPCWLGPSPGVSTPPLWGSPVSWQQPGSSQCPHSVPGSPGTTLMALGWLLEQTELIPHVPSVAVGAVTVISPLELIRTKMQSQQLSYRELRLCIQSAVAQDGWLSLWRGWGPTVLRDVPFSGMPGDRGTWGHRAALLEGVGVPSVPSLVSPLPQLCTGLTTSW